MSRTIKPLVIPTVTDGQDLLIKLLGDDDPVVLDEVRNKIISLGPDTLLWLRPLSMSNDGILRKNARDIVHHFEQVSARENFLQYCSRKEEQLDLEQGLFMLAKTKYPEINSDAYRAIIDDFARELKVWIKDGPGQSLLERVSKFLFEEKGFTGNMENYYDPDNHFINRIIDRRTGGPVGLCLLYVLIMRRIFGMQVHAIGMPGHAVCCFFSGSQIIYIDAFNLGKLLTRNDCIKHLKAHNHDAREEYLAPMSIRRSLARVCGNLEGIYSDLKRESDAARFRRYLKDLSSSQTN